ncbi:hypothetical protein [Escherichia phage UPEC06]|nr:hypothetical protein [Escherichia phage UPEC06]
MKVKSRTPYDWFWRPACHRDNYVTRTLIWFPYWIRTSITTRRCGNLIL